MFSFFSHKNFLFTSWRKQYMCLCLDVTRSAPKYCFASTVTFRFSAVMQMLRIPAAPTHLIQIKEKTNF